MKKTFRRVGVLLLTLMMFLPNSLVYASEFERQNSEIENQVGEDEEIEELEQPTKSDSGEEQEEQRTSQESNVSEEDISIRTAKVLRGQVSVNDHSDKKGARITLSELDTSDNVVKVLFPTWSKENGQDDVIWYEGKREGSSFYCDVEFENHKSLGTYYTHVYIVNASGEASFVQGTEYASNVPEIQEISISNETSQGFVVNIAGVQNPELIESILVPVWSDKKQNDIMWYQAAKRADGTFYVTVDIKNHKYNAGTYIIHSYVKDITGSLTFGGNKTCNIGFEPGELFVEESRTNVYEISLKGVSWPGGVQEVQFAVWSDRNGQDDIKWYIANRSENGYVCNVEISNHKSLGPFSVHAYIRNQSGELRYVNASSFSVAEPSVDSISIEDANVSKGTFTVKLEGIKQPNAIKEIVVPVWSVEDQSDIVWYTAKNQGNNNYFVDVNIKNHKYNEGNYKAHVYIRDFLGDMVFAGKTSQEMSGENGVISASESNVSAGAYDITFSKATISGGIRLSKQEMIIHIV